MTTERSESVGIEGLSEEDLAKMAIEPWEELKRLRRSADALYLGIGFLEGLATGIDFYTPAIDRGTAARQIREAAIELRELLP